MSSLVAFLRARIAEDEAAAHLAQTAPSGFHGQCEPRPYAEAVSFITDEVSDPNLDAVEAHAARHDPARVLADCAAKRRILDEHRDDRTSCSTCGTAGEYDVPWPCTTVELLALPYADHPDYDPKWRP